MWTAQDVVDYLLTTTGGGAQDGEHRAIRQAAIHGIRDVLQCREWLWHTKTGYFKTQSVSTTVTGMAVGSSTMTFASISNMGVGRILDFPPGYFNQTVRVAGISGSTVTVDQPALLTLNVLGTHAAVANLPASSNTLGDAWNVTAANAVYRWDGAAWMPFGTPTVSVQTFYDLPYTLRSIDALVSDTVGTLHCYISPAEWQRLEVNTKGASEPYYYTIMRSDTNPDNWQVRFVGVPSSGTILHYTYRYTPQPMKYMGFESICRQGTVTTTGTTTVTGIGTAFPTDFAGAVIRFGSATNPADSIGSTTPYAYEQKIVTATTGTSLTMAATVPALSGVKYAVSDLIDASPTMYTAILSSAEMWYARITGKSAADAVALANKDLRRALEDDTISPMSGRPHVFPYPTPRSMGYRSALLPDTGG